MSFSSPNNDELLPATAGSSSSLCELDEMRVRLGAEAWRAVSDPAQVVAHYLVCHPLVATVRYPGLTQDDDYPRASSLLRGGFGPEVYVRLSQEQTWRRFTATTDDAYAQVLRVESTLAAMR